MRPFIIAMDPGKTSGWAMWDNHGHHFESGEDDFYHMAQRLHVAGKMMADKLHIVTEAFLITVNTAKNTQATWSLELNGVAKYVSMAYCDAEATVQLQSAAKRFGSDDRLKSLGWHKPGKGHANDAARHLLLLLVNHGWTDKRLVI